MTDVSKLPQELKEKGLFCLWRYEQRGDKRTKVPYDPRTGRMAQSNDPGTFAPLETAMIVQHHGYDGLGAGIFGEICAIDIDHCVNEDGTFTRIGTDVMTIMDSYTEYSPSGKGLRILFKAPGFSYDKAAYYINNAKLGLEVYVAGATSKYVTVTGNMLAGSDTTLRERGTELKQVLDRFMRREQYAPPERMGLDGRLPLLQRDLPAGTPAVSAPVTSEAPVNAAAIEAFDDLQLLNKAIGSRGGFQFDALYHSNTQGYPSHSEADLALCGNLAFWTGCDKARMDRMFRASGLMRADKWDRPQSGSTYGAITIDKAVRDNMETYRPPIIAQAAVPCKAPAQPGPVEEGDGDEPGPGEQEDNGAQAFDTLSPSLNTNPWPLISGSRAPLPFPLTALPTLGQTMACSVTDSIQVPLDLPACFLLGALSTAVVGRAQVEPWPGYREPLQLFILASANPSERKSATILSQGLEAYTQANEAKKEEMRRMCVDLQAKLE